MAPIISRTGGGGSFSFGFGRRRDSGPKISDAGPIIATGGNQSPASGLEPGNGYKYHTFTGSGELILESGSGNVEVLVVAGGGGGASYQSGGGGGGGLAHNPSTPIKATLGPYTITVGSGGPSTTAGTPSTALGITALGGGKGGRRAEGPMAGGSGGGAGSQHQGPLIHPISATQPSQPQPAGTVNYGNPGGNSPFPTAGPPWQYAGAGGGGAGGAGGSVPPNGNDNGNGGPGAPFPQFNGPLIGVPSLGDVFAGGGGGRGDSIYANGPGGNGGSGGGGAGNNPTGVSGTINTGGGGGGGNPGPGGSGGSGIVVIRYPA